MAEVRRSVKISRARARERPISVLFRVRWNSFISHRYEPSSEKQECCATSQSYDELGRRENDVLNLDEEDLAIDTL